MSTNMNWSGMCLLAQRLGCKCLLAFLVFLIAGSASAQSPEIIRIGMLLPVSGNLARYAAETQPYFKYMIDRINAEGGIKSIGGAKIELVIADNASTTSGTAAEARRLILNERVSLITGPLTTVEVLALTPVVDQLRTPALSYTGGASKSSYLFSTGFLYDRSHAFTLVSMISMLAGRQKDRAIKRVALLYSNYEAGQQVANFMEPLLKAKGFEVVGRVGIDRNAQDQSPAILRLRALKPDVASGLVLAREGALLHRARYNLNYHETIFVGTAAGFDGQALWRELGPEVAGAVLPRNLFAMSGYSEDLNIPAAKDLLREFRANVPSQDPPGYYQVLAAQAARVIQHALELAGSSRPQAIRDAMAKVVIPFGHPHLYMPKEGGIAFGPDNMLTDGSGIMVQWEPDGSRKTVWPPRFATAEARPFR